MIARGTYKPSNWDEHSYGQVGPDMKMTKASAVFNFDGDIEGEALVEYVMFYKHFDENEKEKSNADYVGLMRINGKLNGKAGSFVLKDRGVYGDGESHSELEIIPGSGTGELSGISGRARYDANNGGGACEIEYELH